MCYGCHAMPVYLYITLYLSACALNQKETMKTLKKKEVEMTTLSAWFANSGLNYYFCLDLPTVYLNTFSCYYFLKYITN